MMGCNTGCCLNTALPPASFSLPKHFKLPETLNHSCRRREDGNWAEVDRGLSFLVRLLCTQHIINLNSQLNMDGQNNDCSRLPRTASPEILERYHTFIKSKSSVLGLVTTETGKVHHGYSLSLSYFGGAGDVEGCWGLLVSYETLEDQTKYKMRRFFDRQPLQPLDPSTDRFVYAIAPTLRFGQFASNVGSILAPKCIDGKPTTLVGALYKANGALSTIGGTVLAVDQNSRKHYGLTLATITTGEPVVRVPSRGPDMPARRNHFYSPPVERGEGEVALKPIEESTSAILGDDDAPALEGLEEKSAFVPANLMAGDNPVDVNSMWSIHALNWALVELDKHQDIPVANTLRSGEPIGLSKTEPANGSILLIATSAGDYDLVPRCTLLDSGARVINHHTAGGRRASRFQLLPGFSECLPETNTALKLTMEQPQSSTPGISAHGSSKRQATGSKPVTRSWRWMLRISSMPFR
jgi:hypothetical protein